MSKPPFFAPRGSRDDIEHGMTFMPHFDEKGLIPAITTHATTGEVLMHAYMNAQALTQTIETGEAWYWSRSRKTLWHKGATSGQIQKVKEIRTDCDQDTIWLKVLPQGDGGSCHLGYRSCFYRTLEENAGTKTTSRLVPDK